MNELTAVARARVLLVDDDPDDLLILRTLLGAKGGSDRYVVDEAHEWDEALRLLRQQDYDIALIDYRLGARTGLELVQELAGRPSAPPMILLTGFGASEIDHQALAAGAVDYLEKHRLDADLLDRTLRFALERHRLVVQLSARERMWRALFATNPLPMWLFDPITYQIIEANEVACSLYGYTHKEFLALTLLDLRPESERPRALAYLAAQARSLERVDVGKWVHQRKDGTLMDVQIYRSDVEIDGRDLRLSIAKDITAELRAEKRLQLSESTLRGVLHDLGDGLIVINQARIVEFANGSACQLLERDEEDLVGSVLSPDAFLGGGGGDELVTPSGRLRYVDMRVNPTNWLGTEATTVLLRDVTQQRVNERRLTVLLRSVESSNEGLLIADASAPDLPIVYTNTAFERITGYSSDEVLGENCRFLQGRDTAQPEIAVIRNALATASHCTITLRNYRKDGSLFWNRLTISPVRDPHDRVTHFIGLVSDITEQKVLEEERRYLETHDSVTGLPHYSGMVPFLESRLADALLHGERVAMLFIDLDKFHAVNDALGYAMGDNALRLLSDRMRGIAPQARLMRYAGDEFLAFIPGIAPETDLAQLARQANEAVSEPLAVSSNAVLYLTCSVGATEFPLNANSLQDLVHQADLAMNRAKREGRNDFVVFTADMREALHDRLTLGARMRSAMAQGEFLMYYQPQVDAQDGAIVALEALVRWQSPEFGLLKPKRFVPVAENFGLIVPLGLLIFRSACLQVREWLQQGLTDFRVSVNASVAQIQRPEFVDDIRKILEETSVPPSYLEIEITETMLMDNAERAVTQLRALKALGLRLALDDFGIGYSSLSYLRRFPVDKLKIDQSFVEGLTSDSSQAALVRAMIAMGHHLGLRVLAEGVETLQQSEFLRRCHCDQFQGYYYSEPVPASTVPELLRRRYLGDRSLVDDNSAPTLLLVDDEENILRALVRLLRRDGYRVLTATNAAAAFDVLALNEVHVVLSDQRMPEMSGTEFLRRVKDMYPRTVRMVLSGFTDLASVTDAINRGSIYKFLTKPWEDDDLRDQVRQAFRLYSPET